MDQDIHYSPIAAVIEGFVDVCGLKSAMPEAERKKISRFVKGQAEMSVLEAYETLSTAFFKPELFECKTTRLIHYTLYGIFEWCRECGIPKIGWSDPQRAWKTTLHSFLTANMAFFVFRAKFFIECRCDSDVLFPENPLWFIPKEKRSNVGDVLQWWLGEVALEWDRFCDVVQDVVSENTLRGWINGKKVPSRAKLVKISELDFGFAEKDKVYRRSFFVCMYIVVAVGSFLERMENGLGSEKCAEFKSDFEKFYSHFIETVLEKIVVEGKKYYLDPSEETEAKLGHLLVEEINSRAETDEIVKQVLAGRTGSEAQIDSSPVDELLAHYNEAIVVLPPSLVDLETATEHITAIESGSDMGNVKKVILPFLQGLKSVAEYDIDKADELFWESVQVARFNGVMLTNGILETSLASSCYLYSQKLSNNSGRKQYLQRIKKIISWAEWGGYCTELLDIAEDSRKLALQDWDEFLRRVVERGRRLFEGRFREWLPEKDHKVLRFSENDAVVFKEKYDDLAFKGKVNAIDKGFMRDNNKLTRAISHRDLNRIESLIVRGINLNFRNDNEDNVFYCAMAQVDWEHRLKVAAMILEREQDPILPETLQTSTRATETTAMRLVLGNRNPGLLKLLLKRRVSPKDFFPSEYGPISPLHYAVLTTANDVSDRPFLKGMKGGYGMPGFEVIPYKKIDSSYGSDADAVQNVRLLLEAGADVHEVYRGGWTPLLQAVALNSYEVAQMLLERGALCDSALDTGQTISEMNLTSRMKVLLEKGIRNGQHSTDKLIH